MQDKKEIKITYETLYELMRIEKNRDELQKLEDSFYFDLLDYLKEKDSLLEEIKHKTDIFSASQKEKLEIQMKNIRKLVKDLFDKRASKIITIAINKSRTKTDITDTSNLLREERLFYQVMIDHLNLFREGLLHNIISLNPPVSLTEKKIELSEKEKKSKESGTEKKEMSEKQSFSECQKSKNFSDHAHKSKTFMTHDHESKIHDKSDKKFVRFLKSVDRFVGEELETYGPFEEDDTAYLPNSLAEILIEKGKAEESKE